MHPSVISVSRNCVKDYLDLNQSLENLGALLWPFLLHKVFSQFCPDQYTLYSIRLSLRSQGEICLLASLKVLSQDVERWPKRMLIPIRALQGLNGVNCRINGDLICVVFYMFLHRKLPWLSTESGALPSWLHKRY